jgi:hypothetical protein
MYSEMNPFSHSQSNDMHRFITDVGIFTLAVAFRFPLLLRFDVIAAS